jgi:DtxR family Mn-dependent transcriptional regulator
MFLVKYLDCSWDEIHAEAERLEHATSEFLEEKLDRALGSPSIDPHGDPIPSVDGILCDSSTATLAATETGDVVVVSRVTDSDPEILKYASALGIQLRRKLRVTQTIRFDGSLRVQVGKNEKFISAKLAQNIFVEPARKVKRKKEPS